MLDDHLQSRIDNENNYEKIFVLSENTDKIFIIVQPSGSSLAADFCCYFLPSLKVFVCCRFCLR